MQMRILFLFSILLSMVSLIGCERGAPAPKAEGHDHSKHHHEATADPVAGDKADEPAGPRIETGSFLLAVAPSGSGYEIGKSGEVEIALEGRGDWHVNEEYPIRIDLKAAPAVALKQTELVKDDAKEFGEDRVRFLAGVEPSAAGEHDITCDVSFAMCTEENCILEKRTLAMKLKVE
ncbi:MAG: hypothetical protein ACN4G0_04455 [Polyangiales bacterium]